MAEKMSSSRRSGTLVLVLALIAAALPVAGRLIAGPKGGKIHVEYKPSVGAAQRQQLEARYRLDDRRKLDDTYTWGYTLNDASTDNIRALVDDPAVEDTHEIDRHTYTVSPTASRTPRLQRFAAGDLIVGVGDALSIGLAGAVIILLVAPTSAAQVLTRGIPRIDAVTAGIFRIVFGTAVVAFFTMHPVQSSWLQTTFDLEVESHVHAAVLDWLRARPAIVDALTPWLLITGVAFTIGFCTRISYALFVLGTVVWGFVAVSLESIHPLGTFLLSLVALLPSRWGDAWSCDAWLRRLRGHGSAVGDPGAEYGYSVWVPGLAFGVGFAAAAWAKLTVPATPAAWILNGTIKYHFVTDANRAPVEWGLQLVQHPLLAIAASFFAIATEALVVTAAFVRDERYRGVIGLSAVGLVGGFYVFMGHFWPGWWIQLLAFLPWQYFSGLVAAPAQRPSASVAIRAWPAKSLVRTMQVTMIALVMQQQIMLSRIQLELAPMFSWYPMYSTTYASTADWDSRRAPQYRLVALTEHGPVELRRCPPYEEFVRAFQAALAGAPEAETNVWHTLESCQVNVGAVQEVTLEGELHGFDWNRLVFVTRPVPSIGPLRRATNTTASMQPRS